MDNQINIEKENVLNAYKNGNQDQKALLENLFGKDIFQPKDIKERVKTFEDACKELGDNHPFVLQYNTLRDSGGNGIDVADIAAYLKLRIITAALNEGWKPTFDKYEWRHYPWFYVYTKKEYEELDEDDKKSCRVPLRLNSHASAYGGLVFTNAIHAGSNSCTHIGSRLAFKTKGLAEYCSKQFINEWADFLFA